MFRPFDRVLVLTPGPEHELRSWAGALTEGSLVILAEGDLLYDLRRRLAPLTNVMVSPGNRAEIPWGDGCFDVIIDHSGQPPTPEMKRVQVK